MNITKEMATEALVLAHLNEEKGDMVSSTKSCIADAERLYDEGKYELAFRWAARSLKYSVGLFHEDYKYVSALIQ